MRYERHIALPEFGAAGQRRLRDARVLIVGVGGLGSPAALYLAAAGVGTLGLVDFDVVDETNLQRQILYGTADVGAPKLATAAARLRALNPDVALELHDEPFSAPTPAASSTPTTSSSTAPTTFPRAISSTTPVSWRGGLMSMAASFASKDRRLSSPRRPLPGAAPGPCYRCLHPEPPPDGLIPNCAEGGVLGVLPGIIGMIQATEAIKLVTGIGEPLVGRLLLYDALKLRFREIALPRDPECPVCGDHPTIRDLVAYDPACAPVSRGDGMASSDAEVTVEVLHDWRRAARPHALLDVREPAELAIARIDDALHIPLGELAAHLDRLPTDRPVVVFCQSGGRSRRATEALRQQGFDARNLAGGISAWSAQIDPSIPRY